MSLQIDLINADLAEDPEELHKAIARAANLLPDLPEGDWAATVLIATRPEVERLHSQFFGDPTDTDVMSFPSGENLAQSTGYLGDVAVSLTRATEQALEAGHSVSREITFLALHGLLHLLGFDDGTPEQRQNMIDIQTAALIASESKMLP